MLSLGWTELFIIGAIALIVVGPRDLPAMLRNLGRVAGTIRRMGNEFRGELGKVAALDDIKSVRESVTNPLKKASGEIAREFNKIDGNRTVPSGAIKPAVDGAQSVTDEIRAAAGLGAEEKPAVVKRTPGKKPAAKAAKPQPAKATPAKAKPAKAKSVKAQPAKAKPAKAKPAKTKLAKTKPAKTKLAKTKPEAKPVVAKPAARAKPATKPVASKPVATKPVASKPVATKPVASKPVASKPVASKPVATKPRARRVSTASAPD